MAQEMRSETSLRGHTSPVAIVREDSSKSMVTKWPGAMVVIKTRI